MEALVDDADVAPGRRRPRRRWTARSADLAVCLALVAVACGDDGASGAPAGGGSGEPLPECLDFEDLYALTGPESEGFGNWTDAAPLAAELASDTEFPDAPLTVAGPGEESGTYDTYVELVIAPIAEERGVEEATRTDYLSSPNDNVIVENLTGADSSLGWVGFAFYIENTSVLSAFEVSHEAEGEACAAPTPEAIRSGDYPLSRELYIYVNQARAAESGTLRAYVDRYLGDLYDCVVQAGYVRLDEAAMEEAIATWRATGLAGGEPDGTPLEISGSSTVEPISQCVLQFSEFQGAVEGPGTGDGFKRFCAGETDISDASRPIKESEAETCAANGIDYIELPVAVDGIVVMTAA